MCCELFPFVIVVSSDLPSTCNRKPHTPTPRCRGSSLSHFGIRKDKSHCCCPGVIYRLGISSPPPFQVRVTTPAHVFFVFCFSSPPVLWLCRSNDMALRKQRREAEGLSGGNKQAIVCLPVFPLTRPPCMALGRPGDVFRHASLCVSNCPFTCLSMSPSPV